MQDIALNNHKASDIFIWYFLLLWIINNMMLKLKQTVYSCLVVITPKTKTCADISVAQRLSPVGSTAGR